MRLLIRAGNAPVGIVGDRIAPVDTERFDTVLDCPAAVVRPGLINAHDHLHRNHYGRLGRGPYSNAYAWANDIQAQDAARIADGRAIARREALLAGAWKNLFAGVTSVVHHDRWEADFDRDFPMHVVPLQSADSLGMASLDAIDPERPFALHVAEGTDPVARNELALLDRMGLLSPRLVAVHGVGLVGPAITRFRDSGAALVWCPSSNLFLLGSTVSRDLIAPGVDLLLGSDSLLTGAGDLLDELRVARETGFVDDQRLEAAVGEVAARRLGLPPPSLAPGAKADIVLLTRSLFDATAADVSMVVVGGMPRVLEPDLAARLGPHLPPGRVMRRNGISRWIAAEACALPRPDI